MYTTMPSSVEVLLTDVFHYKINTFDKYYISQTSIMGNTMKYYWLALNYNNNCSNQEHFSYENCSYSAFKSLHQCKKDYKTYVINNFQRPQTDIQPRFLFKPIIHQEIGDFVTKNLQNVSESISSDEGETDSTDGPICSQCLQCSLKFTWSIILRVECGGSYHFKPLFSPTVTPDLISETPREAIQHFCQFYEEYIRGQTLESEVIEIHFYVVH